MLYLEMGCVPFKYIVARRRLNFLHYILNEDDSSLIHQVLKSQSEQPVKDDWYLSVVKDLEEFQLDMNFEEIKQLSSFSFHTIVQKSACKKALLDLTKIKMNPWRTFSQLSKNILFGGGQNFHFYQLPAPTIICQFPGDI
jgi:hypothetical protein